MSIELVAWVRKIGALDEGHLWGRCLAVDRGGVRQRSGAVVGVLDSLVELHPSSEPVHDPGDG